LGTPANLATARSISAGSRTLIGLTSTPTAGATAWMIANCPIPWVRLGIAEDRRARNPRGNLLEQFHPLPAQSVLEQHEAGGVASRLRQAFDHSPADRIGDGREHNRHGAGHLQQMFEGGVSRRQDDIRRECNQFGGKFAKTLGLNRRPTALDPYVAAVGPAQLLQRLHERCHPALRLWIVGSKVHEHADPPHPFGLLRPRRERPRRNRAAEQRHELPPSHAGHGRPLQRCRTISLPSTRYQIPVADLNCSEFRVLPPRW
jgi:hypothetical protein